MFLGRAQQIRGVIFISESIVAIPPHFSASTRHRGTHAQRLQFNLFYVARNDLQKYGYFWILLSPQSRRIKACGKRDEFEATAQTILGSDWGPSQIAVEASKYAGSPSEKLLTLLRCHVRLLSASWLSRVCPVCRQNDLEA